MNQWYWAAQLGLDILLVAAVGLLLWRLGRAGGPASGGAAPDVDNFVTEAAQLSKEFDRLLAEKRQLIGSTLAALDSRLKQLHELAGQVERPAAPAPAQAEPVASSGFREQVLDMARQGRTVQEIAQATGRPRGEVELVLDLSK